MGLTRRALIAAATLLATQAFAQTFPGKPVTRVAPNPPGGGVVDTSARLLGQPVVIENQGGASGNIAYPQLALAPKDGHTLLISYSACHVGNPSLFARLPWAQKDFTPVALLIAPPSVMQHVQAGKVKAALDTPEAKGAAGRAGTDIRYLGPDALNALGQKETSQWADVMKAKTIRAD